jgi:hypothetical protein
LNREWGTDFDGALLLTEEAQNKYANTTIMPIGEQNNNGAQGAAKAVTSTVCILTLNESFSIPF